MESLTHAAHHRRSFLRMAGAAWLTPLAATLARAAEKQADPKRPAKSVILLWMDGGPSQLETFDPHPGTDIAAGTSAIDTAVKGVQLAAGFGRLAERMADVSLIRSMVSKEGDHERGAYNLKTGHRPDPTVVHPSLGAVLCHELPAAGTDIPRHVSILPGQWPGKGGYLGDKYNAFLMYDPAGPVPDTTTGLPAKQVADRLKGLDVVDGAFAQGRGKRAEATGHRDTMARARQMMTSEQLAAFDVSKEPLAVRRKYGESAFGRGCLAARRLVEVGVRCVEVTLGGWDSHVNNHEICRNRLTELDPAFAALLEDLKERKLLGSTVVLCAGEFGRTPRLNPAGGRDHWPVGFSVAVAGGGVRGGQVIGATDPAGKADPTDPVTVADLHATVYAAAGVEYDRTNQTPIGRTVKYSEGRPVEKLLS